MKAKSANLLVKTSGARPLRETNPLPLIAGNRLDILNRDNH